MRKYILFATPRATWVAKQHASALRVSGVGNAEVRWSANKLNGLVRAPASGVLPKAFASGRWIVITHAQAIGMVALSQWTAAPGD